MGKKCSGQYLGSIRPPKRAKNDILRLFILVFLAKMAKISEIFLRQKKKKKKKNLFIFWLNIHFFVGKKCSDQYLGSTRPPKRVKNDILRLFILVLK